MFCQSNPQRHEKVGTTHSTFVVLIAQHFDSVELRILCLSFRFADLESQAKYSS